MEEDLPALRAHMEHEHGLRGVEDEDLAVAHHHDHRDAFPEVTTPPRAAFMRHKHVTLADLED